MDVYLEPGAEFQLPVPTAHTVVAYVFEGAGSFGADDHAGGGSVEAVKLVIFAQGDRIVARGGEQSSVRFMLMAGAPFHEPIVPYGPFVMNTEDEIRQALSDLRNGTFVENSAI
jgi:redox-sensitive bicupin YhaK (pirin superfamily)